MYDGDQHNRAAKGVTPNDNSFWNDKEANRLAHTSIYTATRQTANKDTQVCVRGTTDTHTHTYIHTHTDTRALAHSHTHTKTQTGPHLCV